MGNVHGRPELEIIQHAAWSVQADQYRLQIEKKVGEKAVWVS